MDCINKFNFKAVRFFVFLFTSCLLLCVASGAQSFSDVESDSWYYGDVEYMVQAGFVKGYPDGTFAPNSNITRAEFITLLSRVCAYEAEGGQYFSDTFLDSSRKLLWYNDYVSACLENNVIYKDDYEDAFMPENYILRSEAATFVYRSLNLSGCAYQNPYDDCNNSYLTVLFWENIMHGTDNGQEINFYPDEYLTRAQSCALLKRVYEYKQNKEEYIENYKAVYGEKVPYLTQKPHTREEFVSLLVYGVENELSELEFVYEGVSFYDETNDIIQSNLFEAYRIASAAYPELFSLIGIEYEKNGNFIFTQIKIKFVSTEENVLLSDIYYANSLAKEYAQVVAQNVFSVYTDDGAKLEAIHDFLVANCEYDQSFTQPFSFTAYGALFNQKAVCQGYSAAFNLIAKACGIKSISVQNDVHAWNCALVKGKALHYDATWDDPIIDGKDSGKVFKDYCGIPENKITQSRTFDKELYKTQLFDGVGF